MGLQPVSPSYSQAGFDGLVSGSCCWTEVLDLALLSPEPGLRVTQTSGTAAQLQFYGQETSRQKDQEQLKRLQQTVAELRRAAADSEAQQVGMDALRCLRMCK